MGRKCKGAGFKFILVLAAGLLVLLTQTGIVQAISEAEQTFLAMYFTEDELRVVSATRSLQSISRIAENIEVVTAADIELMNAHTLADALKAVSGTVVSNFGGGMGTRATFDIQGAGRGRVTVLIDGVPVNNLSEASAEIGFFPVQQIERIEIVKGPASSAWGSALAGVVNVVTKGPGNKPFQGMASLDYGSKNSADYRAEVSGRSGRLGYYVAGTGLRTDGLTEGFDVHAGYGNAKLQYALGERTSATFSLFYGDSSPGDGISAPDDLSFSLRTRRLFSNLTLSSELGRGHATLSAWTTTNRIDYWVRQMSTTEALYAGLTREHQSGGNLNYDWSGGNHNFVVGADYSEGEVSNVDIPGVKPTVTRWAVFANDTITLGRWTIAPGLRYDQTSIADGFLSPSIGAVCLVSKDFLLRATVARGFSDPTPAATSATSDFTGYVANPDLEREKVWSYQVGAEANVLSLFRLKVSAFRHDITDVLTDTASDDDGHWTELNHGRERRLGVEVGVQTRPFQHFTLAGDAFFMSTKDLETRKDLLDVPKRIFDLSLKYDDERSLRGILTGRYWHADEPPEYNADLGGFIFDVNVIKKLALSPGISLEAFLSIHNLFNGEQYSVDVYKNASRWVEGGLRASF